MTPSIDRSIDPCRMMNVVPTARISGMAERLAIVHRFSTVANPGSARPKPRHKTPRASKGAHGRSSGPADAGLYATGP